jgi:hypothetical protein
MRRKTYEHLLTLIAELSEQLEDLTARVDKIVDPTKWKRWEPLERNTRISDPIDVQGMAREVSAEYCATVFYEDEWGPNKYL